MATRKRRKHKDVEFMIESYGRDHYTHDPQNALAKAAEMAMSNGRSTLDVLIYSKAGARFYGGDDAVAQYNEDPEASVFERYVFSVNAQGRIS